VPPTEAEWRSQLPRLVPDYTRRWNLRLGTPFTGGSASFTAPATTPDGTPAVLKLSWPHREADFEADALQWWDGRGAVRLLQQDRRHYALLIERCEPGLRLGDHHELAADRRLIVAAELLAGLWRTGVPETAPYERVADVTAEWADLAARRMETIRPPYDPGLVAQGVDLLRSLPTSATRTVIVHGDFNPGNILSATRCPWLVIDPKPMIGDPGYDLAPLVLQVDDPFRHSDVRAVLRTRFGLVSDALGEPVDRLVAWSVARGVEAALWHAARSEMSEGADEMARTATLAHLIS
jgi:streptomycin 6-kinase